MCDLKRFTSHHCHELLLIMMSNKVNFEKANLTVIQFPVLLHQEQIYNVKF
ncbi:hypothetical protein SUSAZ_01150 [Sulfolobus acidocaldarius SUSAZ]|nr:hypothetical protein SUSAZ_01150 [Sulfolobus acidocaldarius SUSAZ]